MGSKILVRNLVIILFFLSTSKIALSENVTADKTISSDSTTQQTVTADNITLTISNNATLSRNQKPAVANNRTGVTVTVNTGSEIFTTASDNAVIGQGSTNLTVNNSGKIYSAELKQFHLEKLAARLLLIILEE